MPTIACLNGELTPIEDAKISVWDRGFLFGDAVYEVILHREGRYRLFDEHRERLERSLREIKIVGCDLERLFARMDRTVAAVGSPDSIVYIHITRGVAPRRHAFPIPPVEPTELIVAWPYDDSKNAELREKDVGVIIEPDFRWKRRDIKSTNLLANVLACEEARRADCFEAVLYDGEGYITEATHSSLLWVRDNELQATYEGYDILPGTTRRFVVELAGIEEIRFSEKRVSVVELEQADEILLAGTSIEILPVVSVGSRKVGDGTPGPITRRLQAAYKRLAR